MWSTFLSQSLNIHNLWAKLVCIPKNVFSPTAVSKLFIDLYYFVKSSFLKIETANDDVSYIHSIPTGTNRNWKCRFRPETKVMKKLQIIFLSNAKFFAVILFRSKAHLMLRNWKNNVFAGFHSTTIVLIADKHFSFFLTKLKNKPPNLQR